MFDIQKMMKQAQEMQAKMQAAQDELANETIVGHAGGDAVSITANAKMEFQSVVISPEAYDDKEMLEDLILTALKDVSAQSAEKTQEKMQAITGGVNIPGLKLPF